VTSDSCFAAAALSALAVVVNGEAVLLSPRQGDAYGQRWVDRELLRSGVREGTGARCRRDRPMAQDFPGGHASEAKYGNAPPNACCIGCTSAASILPVTRSAKASPAARCAKGCERTPECDAGQQL